MNNQQKIWLQNAEQQEFWDSQKKRKVQLKEAKKILEWINLYTPKSKIILEIGCGNGYVGKYLVDNYIGQKRSLFYTFSDIVPQCLNYAKKIVNFKNNPKIVFKKIDVFKLEQSIKENSQDVIISTGYAAAATYRNAVKHVVACLKPGGILITDFINHLSPLFWILHPIYAIKLFKRYKSGKDKVYHFGILGIEDYFRKYGLEILDQNYIGLHFNPLLIIFKKTK